MSMLGNLQMLLLAAVAFSLIASVVVSLAVPLLVRYTSAWAPASRHKALMLLGLALPMFTLAALVSLLSPSFLAYAWPELDHCLLHEGHAHLHLCLVHLSHDASSWLGWVVIAGVMIGLGARLGVRTLSLLNAPKLIHRLLGLARFDSHRGAWVVPTGHPLCLSVGLLRPRVLVSDGLLAAASNDELEVMLAHEAAHVRRRDTLARLFVRAGSLLLAPGARGLLLSTLELSAEQACDEAAAAQVGDRLRVAETILAMERLLGCSTGSSSMVAAFGASSISARVQSLLLPPRSPNTSPVLTLLWVGAVVTVVALGPRLHHVTESTLAFLAH